MQLFHFSDSGEIKTFVPRPVQTPSKRTAGNEWMNDPLVWAVDERHQPVYLFPRDCPRIVMWPTEATSHIDRERWMGDGNAAMVAHVEWDWLDRIRAWRLYRYEFSMDGFESVQGDEWMWVSRRTQIPCSVTEISDLLQALAAANVELRFVSSLAHLRTAWNSTMHVSGIRLRNARSWVD